MLALLVAACLPAKAQSRLDSAQYSLAMKFSGNRSTGIFSRNVFLASTEAHFQTQQWRLYNSLSYRYSNINGLLFENNLYELLTLIFYPNQRKSWFPLAFYHYDNNLLFQVNSRHRGGVGLGSVVLRQDQVFLEAAVGIGYEATEYNGTVFINSELEEAIRENGLAIFRLNLDLSFLEKRLVLHTTLLHMHSLKESQDYELWVRPSLIYRISSHISLSVNYDYRYERVHLEGLPPANDILLYGLNINLAHKP
ncbi:MAG: DUF481 domain-containing protein [Bacteroidota bacterium]